MAAAGRVAWRNARTFAILWLVLLMWLAAAALAGAALAAVVQLASLIPAVESYPGIVLRAILSALGASALTAIIAIFGLAIFRCIGAFGQYVQAEGNPQITQMAQSKE